MALREHSGPKSDNVELNSSLYLSSEALFSASSALGGYLEWESHRRSRRAEVNNEGYGSLRNPKWRSTLPDGSPLAQWLEQLRTVRVDLRFREDGVHTTLTLDRKAAKK